MQRAASLRPGGLGRSNAGKLGALTKPISVMIGTPSASTSVVDTSAATIAADGSASATITVTAKTSGSVAIQNCTVTLSATGAGNTITQPSTVTDANGQTTGVFKTTGATAHTISAIIDGVSITDTASVTGTASNTPDATKCTVSINDSTLVLGSETATATLQAKDSSNVNITVGGATVVFDNSGGVSDGSWSATTDHADGTYSAVFTPSVAGSATTLVVTINGNTVTTTMPTITVSGSYSAPDLANVDFEDGTDGVLVNPFSPSNMTFPADPTSRATGKVVKYTYNPSSGGSMEKGSRYTASPVISYGYTIWHRAKLYIDSSGAGANYKKSHNRKLIDWFGTAAVGGIRMTLHRTGTNGDLKFSYVDTSTGTEAERFDADTGIDLADDTWHTIEVKMVTNSADGVADGELHIYMNGAATPTYSRTTSLKWIQEGPTKQTRFERLFIGYQLTINSGDATYTDTRYFDDVAFSTSRIGP